MIRIIEMLVALYCLTGMLTGIPALTYVGIGVSLLAQALSLVVIISYGQKRSIPRAPLTFYIVNLVVLSSIVSIFLLGDNPTSLVLNRGLSLLSIFGLSILFCIPAISIKRIVRTVLSLFTGLGVIITLDSMCYLVFGFSIWPPEVYLDNRFAGPFFDPNFLSITYAILLIVALFDKYSATRVRTFRLAIFFIVILLGGSWSAIGLLCISLLLSKIIRNKNYGGKQIIILAAYLITLPILLANLTPLYNTFESTVTKIGIEPPEARAKFKSFEYRVVAQNDALVGIIENPLGYGPQSLVPNIGRDTHNSYIGFTYELGVLGLGLLMLNMSYRRKKYDPMKNALTTFFFLIALTINIHYSSVYLVLLLLINKGSDWKTEDRKSANKSVKRQKVGIA